MKYRRAIYFASGAVLGYLAGAAAGRERFDAIMDKLSGAADQAGLPEFGTKLAERGADVARTASVAAGDLIDAAADKATSTVEDVSDKAKPGGAG